MKDTHSKIVMVVILAMLVAFISYFMPFVTTRGWLTYSSTGFEVLKLAQENDEAGWPTIAIIVTAIGAVVAVVCGFNGSKLTIPLISSVICEISVLTYFSESMDYVTNGFWVFVIAHAVSIVLSIISLLIGTDSSEDNMEEDVDEKNIESFVELDVQVAECYCAECGAPIKSSCVVCPSCGTRLD